MWAVVVAAALAIQCVKAFSLPSSPSLLQLQSIDRNSNRNHGKRSSCFRSSQMMQSDFSSNSLLQLRGGALPSSIASIKSSLLASPFSLFNGAFAALMLSVGALKIWPAGKASSSSSAAEAKSKEVKALQMRFLIVFWLMRIGDWLQGPYFYEVYASKIINGQAVSLDMVSKLFLVGFASTGLLGPWVGRQVDSRGRKLGTLMFACLYAVGALSTRSSLLPLLLLGRVAGGIGTSLLFSAPEAWLVGEHLMGGYDGRWLGQTFGWAYAGDSLVAIAAGQFASMAALRAGPTGPFTLSVAFLALGSLLCASLWRENKAAPAASGQREGSAKNPTILDAAQLVLKDKRILLVGAVQALFEGAMYIFVLQWPPAIKAAILSSQWWGAQSAGLAVPYGKIFSCFMASCLFGSSLFGKLQSGSRKISVEKSTAAMLFVASAALASTAMTAAPALAPLVAAFFAFEACVGMYFPSIGTLRSKYLPDSHRSVMMNLFGIPLNLIVVSVFLSIRSLGVQGALRIASAALAIACASMTALAAMAGKEAQLQSGTKATSNSSS